MMVFIDSIGDLSWWLSNGLRVWESIIQKVGSKTREMLFETRREIKMDIFVSQFTKFVRFFNIEIGESIKIRTEYKLWFLGGTVDLQDTFLDIPEEIEFTFPCAERIKLLFISFINSFLSFKRVLLNL
jgi:hypothetical protein